MKPFGVNGTLKIAYGPVTFYEFQDILDHKNERPNAVAAINKASIYMLAKRNLQFLSIEDCCLDPDTNELVSLTLLAGSKETKTVEIQINVSENIGLQSKGIKKVRCSTEHMEQNPVESTPLHVIQLLDENDECVLWFSFDILIAMYHNNEIVIHIKGDITPLITYEVLYIGRTGDLFKRYANGHKTMMKILNTERIISEGYDKANELIVIPFEVCSSTMSIIDLSGDDELLGEKILAGGELISDTPIYHDCEKALIKALDPLYNDEDKKYKNYPKVSNDGLNKYNLDLISFIIDENMILTSGTKILYGCTNDHCTIIQIVNNEDYRLVNMPFSNQ